MKSRKKPSQRARALLQKEISSQCPFCISQEVDTFEVHHLNEIPDDDRLENEIMICPTCHTKIHAGTIPRNEVYIKKFKLMEAAKQGNQQIPSPHERPSNNITQINLGDKTIQVAGDLTVQMMQNRRAKAAVPVSGVIGTSPNERSYIEYLYHRLIDYKKAIPGYDSKRAGSIVARYVSGAFGTTWTYVPIEKFDSLVSLLQQKIEETPIGRKHKKNGTKAYSSFEEHMNRKI